MLSDCGPDLRAARLYLIATNPGDVPAVTLAEVEPSTAARERALLSGAGSSEALKPAALACTDVTHTPTADATTEYRWLAVDNVALLVRTYHGPTTEDRAFWTGFAGALERATTPAQ